ncbi:hypothetical protein [Candidatus Protofrankia californiensis]|uniref:hypothetical protein n=1 Tax=Candidatus Protofrankia californiensis TaxID=1839754 RepID=UPI001041AE27|nr:hypothetical protein [Candidatus Protofrankia californiensis]
MLGVFDREMLTFQRPGSQASGDAKNMIAPPSALHDPGAEPPAAREKSDHAAFGHLVEDPKNAWMYRHALLVGNLDTSKAQPLPLIGTTAVPATPLALA